LVLSGLTAEAREISYRLLHEVVKPEQDAVVARIDLPGLRTIITVRQHKTGGTIMAWHTPKITVVALGAEINSYACADLKK
jgi:coenzyme PQQ precursor peptide PqqA